MRRLTAAVALATASLAAFGCTHRGQVSQPNAVTLYFCKAGSEALVPVRYTVSPALRGAELAGYVVNQLLAGPTPQQGPVVLFPTGTRATVTVGGNAATVDFDGAVASGLPGGTSDEVAMFKSLTYSLTGLQGIDSVQVLVRGSKRATLPGGHLEIDEPLTRETFAQ